MSAIVGFSWGGWVTGGTAERMAEDAVIKRLAGVCSMQFSQDSEKDQKLRELTKKSTWDKELFIEKHGWATMPGEGKPNRMVIEECTKLIMKIN